MNKLLENHLHQHFVRIHLLKHLLIQNCLYHNFVLYTALLLKKQYLNLLCKPKHQSVYKSCKILLLCLCIMLMYHPGFILFCVKFYEHLFVLLSLHFVSYILLVLCLYLLLFLLPNLVLLVLLHIFLHQTQYLFVF